MNVIELIAVLKTLPNNTKITLYNNQYSGGADLDLESNPVLLLTENLDLVICDDFTENFARTYYGKLVAIEELI